MRRLFLSSALVFGLIFVQLPVASAFTEGCPDTWKIDTSSRAGIEELQQAKIRLGTDLALSEPLIQYRNYAGELGTLPPPGDGQELAVQDIYLYGKTLVQYLFNVQVKNCPTKTTFSINLGTLTEYLGYKSLIANVDPKVWAETNAQGFVDFTKAENFGACLKSLQASISPQNLGGQLEGNLFVIGAISGVLRQRSNRDPCGVIKSTQQRTFTYLDLTPDCRYFSTLSDRSTALRKGGSCEIAIALPVSNDLVAFTKFSLKAKDYEAKVTCSKGKVTKIFTVYRGYEFRVKCPAGYSIRK